jgi:hypothetical protein
MTSTEVIAAQVYSDLQYSFPRDQRQPYQAPFAHTLSHGFSEHALETVDF